MTIKPRTTLTAKLTGDPDDALKVVSMVNTFHMHCEVAPDGLVVTGPSDIMLGLVTGLLNMVADGRLEKSTIRLSRETIEVDC